MLKRAGITARVRSVDATQFEQRRQTYDFDMIPFVWTQSLSPGNEQLFYWSAEAARTPGTRNYPGIEDPAVGAEGHAVGRGREQLGDERRVAQGLGGGLADPVDHEGGHELLNASRHRARV